WLDVAGDGAGDAAHLAGRAIGWHGQNLQRAQMGGDTCRSFWCGALVHQARGWRTGRPDRQRWPARQGGGIILRTIVALTSKGYGRMGHLCVARFVSARVVETLSVSPVAGAAQSDAGDLPGAGVPYRGPDAGRLLGRRHRCVDDRAAFWRFDRGRAVACTAHWSKSASFRPYCFWQRAKLMLAP